jgi:hypothetical protein
MEYTWANTWKYVSRFSRFVNGPELITMIRSVFDVQMGKELLNIPKLAGGNVEFVKVPTTPPMKQVRHWIDRIAARWEQFTPKQRKENSWVPIVAMGYGTAAALDPRLVIPDAIDDPGSKVNTAVKNIVSDYHSSTDRKGTQLVFADRFLPLNTAKLMSIFPSEASSPEMDALVSVDESDSADDNSDDAFDAEAMEKRSRAESDAYKAAKWTIYKDMKDKLVKAGIPEAEIAIIHDFNSDKMREKLFADVNAGKIRVLFGSTEKLGVGVNVQERLFSAHLLDLTHDFRSHVFVIVIKSEGVLDGETTTDVEGVKVWTFLL